MQLTLLLGGALCHPLLLGCRRRLAPPFGNFLLNLLLVSLKLADQRHEVSLSAWRTSLGIFVSNLLILSLQASCAALQLGRERSRGEVYEVIGQLEGSGDNWGIVGRVVGGERGTVGRHCGLRDIECNHRDVKNICKLSVGAACRWKVIYQHEESTRDV